MILSLKTYEEFETCAYKLSQLSFLWRVLLTADLSGTEWNSMVFYDVLYSFTENLSQISDTLNRLQDRFEFTSEDKRENN